MVMSARAARALTDPLLSCLFDSLTSSPLSTSPLQLHNTDDQDKTKPSGPSNTPHHYPFCFFWRAPRCWPPFFLCTQTMVLVCICFWGVCAPSAQRALCCEHRQDIVCVGVGVGKIASALTSRQVVSTTKSFVSSRVCKVASSHVLFLCGSHVKSRQERNAFLSPRTPHNHCRVIIIIKCLL